MLKAGGLSFARVIDARDVAYPLEATWKLSVLNLSIGLQSYMTVTAKESIQLVRPTETLSVSIEYLRMFSHGRDKIFHIFFIYLSYIFVFQAPDF